MACNKNGNDLTKHTHGIGCGGPLGGHFRGIRMHLTPRGWMALSPGIPGL